MQPGRELTRAKWERLTEWPLIIAALLFLTAYAVPIIWPDIDHPLLEYASWLMAGTWVAFGVDFAVRLGLAANRIAFFKHNFIDFLSIILPVLRPLRVLRLIAALSILTRFGVHSLRRKVAFYFATVTAVLTFLAALAVTQAERGAGVVSASASSSIQSFGDGLWWAVVTVTTVGYGDFAPVTVAGRVIAAALMFVGVLLLGAVAASLASWLVQRSAEAEAELEAETSGVGAEDVGGLLAQMDGLNAQVAALSDALKSHAASHHAAGRRDAKAPSSSTNRSHSPTLINLFHRRHHRARNQSSKGGAS